MGVATRSYTLAGAASMSRPRGREQTHTAAPIGHISTALTMPSAAPSVGPTTYGARSKGRG